MFELINAGSWVMWPLIACSIIALAIIGERFWSLRHSRIIPDGLTRQVWEWSQKGELDKAKLDYLRSHSALGRILAAALIQLHADREAMKNSISEISNQVSHELEYYLNTLGTIAEIAPLLGLLGTVTGIIKMLAAVGAEGLGNPQVLSSGLAEALLTTAAGLFVAIPAFVFYRFFRGRVDTLQLGIEQETLRLLDALHRQQKTERST